MTEQKIEPKSPEGLEPRPAFTIFDLLHLLFTLVAAIAAAGFTRIRFVKIWGFFAFVLVAVAGFFGVGYATAGFVLVLSRRYTPRCLIG